MELYNIKIVKVILQRLFKEWWSKGSRCGCCGFKGCGDEGRLKGRFNRIRDKISKTDVCGCRNNHHRQCGGGWVDDEIFYYMNVKANTLF